MTQVQAGWSTRSYREGDMPGIVDVYNAGFVADGADIAYGEADILAIISRPDFDLQRQVVIVDGPAVEGAPDCVVLGFGAVRLRDNKADNSRSYFLELAVHPSTVDRELHRAIASRLVAIAREMERDPGRQAVERVRLKTVFSPKSEWLKALFEELGLKEVRRFYLMTCPLDALEEPQAIEGVRIRGYRRPGDEDASRAAYNASFIDHFDFEPATREEWAYRINLSHQLPGLSWVAEIDSEPGRLAGFCMCAVFEEENEKMQRNWGWIDLLGTVRGWRHKGLGRSLLLHGLHSLKSAGYDTGALGVDTDSPTGATRLYESVGFSTHSLWLNYEARLDEVKV